ncbi:helicase [Paenibacillus sp. Root52]|uniref:hypothetical protein n=1 Tax=Paenibacillus sp. Root52 TaxID=1736552 RepID=UPI0006F5BF91|nr:hypothetical protein [Paenibacillus sp. Root52]KQY94467.1 helicase [Paenibacillus sp. Root52]
MRIENEKSFNGERLKRTVEVGGLTRTQLIQKLQQNTILMNELGKKLLADDKFRTSETKYSVEIVELTVGELGFPDGATTSRIFAKAIELDLELCPLELGPYLRLVYLDQPEGYSGKPVQQHRAPVGSVTIASEILTDDEGFPKGFYLRKMDGVLWLRGYCADHLHVWNPDDHFIFRQSDKTLKD